MMLGREEGTSEEIYITGTIEEADAAVSNEGSVVYEREIQSKLKKCRGKPLTIYINSYGGSVAAGMAIANMISRHDALTTAIVDGYCCSIATQIFFSADKCKMPSNAYLMIHAPSGEVQGTAAEMRRSAEALDVIRAGLLTTYKKKARATTSEEELLSMLDGERWLTGAEAATLFDIEILKPMKEIRCCGLRKECRSAAIPPGLRFIDDSRGDDEVRRERKERKMMRSDELKQSIGEKQTDIGYYHRMKDYENERKAVAELQIMKEALESVERKEEEDFRSLVAHAVPIADGCGHPIASGFGNTITDAGKLRNRAFNKLVFSRVKGEPPMLTEEEKRAYYNVSGSPGEPGQIEAVPGRGGYLISGDQMRMLQEFRKAFVSLKDYVTIINTTSAYGHWPTLPDQQIEFAPLVEMTDVSESELMFSELEYKIKDYGLIVPASNQLLEDIDVDLVGVIGRTLAKGAVRTENKKILEPLQTLITGDTATGIAATTITSYKELNVALYRTLDGAYEPNAKIYVNQDAFLWLSNLEDAQERPLLVPDVTAPNKYFYRGKEIVVIPNTILANTTVGSNTYAPIFIGDLSAYLTFFERKGLELTTSADYLWRKNGFAVRGIIRFDVVKTDPDAIVALQVKVLP